MLRRTLRPRSVSVEKKLESIDNVCFEHEMGKWQHTGHVLAILRVRLNKHL